VKFSQLSAGAVLSMAKKKAAGGIAEGTPITVKPGVTSPEFSEVSIAGWTGKISEVTGKAPSQKLIIEWDDATLAKMPADYLAKCEAQQLYHRMACLPLEDVELPAS
jgi:hypothetical protein